MTQMLVSQEKINSITAGLFAIGLGVFYYLGITELWAGLLLIGGISLVVRQLLNNKIVDLFMVIIVFGGSWFTTYYEIRTDFFVPILLFVGAIYVIISQIAYYMMRRRPRRPIATPKEGEGIDHTPPVGGEEDDDYPLDYPQY